MGPQNFNINVATPIQRVLADQQTRKDNEARQQQIGLQTRQVVLQEQQFAQQQAAQQSQVQAAQAKVKAVGDFAAIPNKTAKDYSDIINQHPDLAEQFKTSYNILDQANQRTAVTDATQLYSAIDSGSSDIAEGLLTRRMEAAKNSGDQKSYAGAKATLEMLKTDPLAAKTSVGLFLASTEPTAFEALQGIEQTRHDRSREGVTDGHADRTHELAVRKQNAEIATQGLKSGLTQAQINKTMVETRKLGAETRKAIMEVEAIGGADGTTVVTDPEKRFNMEEKLRKEYNKEIGTFTETQDAFNRVNAAEKTAVGDIALITSYMKMIDPGSVVREGEFATAQNAAGAGDKFRNTYNKILSGERLTDSQRKDFKSQAKSLLGASKKRETQVRKGIAPVIKRYGLSEDSVFYTPEAETSPPPPAGGGASDDPLGLR